MKLLMIRCALIVGFTFRRGSGTLIKQQQRIEMGLIMRQDRLLRFLQIKLQKLMMKSQQGGETISWENYETEESDKKLMAKSNEEYTTKQIADIYSKLEVSKLLISMGTDIAKQVETDIKFYRMTNDSDK